MLPTTTDSGKSSYPTCFKVTKKMLCLFTENLYGSTPATTESPAEKEQRHQDLMEENVEVGIMFASKAFVQLIANPFVGPLTHKYILL